jgi:hypothetical protein
MRRSFTRLAFAGAGRPGKPCGAIVASREGERLDPDQRPHGRDVSNPPVKKPEDTEEDTDMTAIRGYVPAADRGGLGVHSLDHFVLAGPTLSRQSASIRISGSTLRPPPARLR